MHSTLRTIASIAALALAASLSLATYAAPPIRTKAVAAPTPNTYPTAINRYALSKDFTFPKVATVTLIPFDTVRYEQGAFTALNADGMIVVQQTGLYQISLGLDWKAQEGTDHDTRMYGIRRKAVGDNTAPSLQDERIASFDHPGSDSPATGRFNGTWGGMFLEAGGMTYTDLNIMPAFGAINVGDVAQASLSSLSETVIGIEASLKVQVRAQVIGPDTVRVILENRSTTGVQIPTGSLKVLAQSTTVFRGESEDAWNVLHSPMIELIAGEKLYIVGKNQGIPKDYIQASKNSTFVQITKIH